MPKCVPVVKKINREWWILKTRAAKRHGAGVDGEKYFDLFYLKY